MAIFQPKMAQKWPLMAKIPNFFYESCEAIKMVPYGEFSSILLLSSQKNYVLCPSENIENCLNLFCHYFSNYGNYFSKLAEGTISILFAFYYWDLNAFEPLSGFFRPFRHSWVMFQRGVHPIRLKYTLVMILHLIFCGPDLILGSKTNIYPHQPTPIS